MLPVPSIPFLSIPCLPVPSTPFLSIPCLPDPALPFPTPPCLPHLNRPLRAHPCLPLLSTYGLASPAYATALAFNDCKVINTSSNSGEMPSAIATDLALYREAIALANSRAATSLALSLS